MTDHLNNAIAIVGVGAILPDAPDASSFWRNVTAGRYSISEVDKERWDPALYYDPDPRAPAKTYSKIGGWVREWEWDPFGWKLPIPPKVGDAMDDAHKWAIACTRMAMMDAGWPDQPLDLDRTAVIIGSAIAGEKQFLTAQRIMFPEVARELERTEGFAALPAGVRSTIERQLLAGFEDWLPDVTEDTIPGELGNCIAGRVANLFNLHGPNFTTDAACASALAALDATVDGLLAHDFDVAITGGVDRNMNPAAFVKFCAIGALSATGTRPYADGADGFVMGEGAALFVVKRLADAVREGDRIYAVVRGIGGSSDGKGKGITAPNPIGQRLAVERAWRNAGISPAECTLMEGHGTSTRVGDAVELSALTEAFSDAHLPPGSVALGSVKSNIGHLKAGAGAAGLLKATLALHDKVLPPSVNFERPNPNLDWTASPFAVNTELRDWEVAAGQSRVAGVSAFGFGGTNFHVVMEEYVPDRATTNGHRSSIAVPAGQTLKQAEGSEQPPSTEPVVITGAALGLPGAERLFDDANVMRLLNGEQGIDGIPSRIRREIVDKHITRLVKGDDGEARFETIDRQDDVIKLAGRAGAFDLGEEFGVDDERLAALGRDTQLAMAAGIDALRDAGIPLVLRYRTTSIGTQLPDHWALPAELRDDTGVIYASAFPGLEEMTDEVSRYTTDHMRRERVEELESLRARMLEHDGADSVVINEVDRRIHDLRRQLEREPYEFNRRFLFRVPAMAHGQLAELIGARGPNTHINAACASTTQAIALAEDWIRAGRCRRVLIVAADDVTSDMMLPWIGSAFLASGAAATDESVEDAALPFDRRRHGMILGMGAAGLVVESAASARERGMTPICEVLGTVTANSAFHGTRLDVEHIGAVMERLVEQAEARGIRRDEIAGETVFISHETYTPARGGSAAAEIHALREVFGENADRIVIANTKGFTGHPMSVGLEDVLAVKAIETGIVPPVPNFREPDPELGDLNLSRGGAYPVRYALRLAAGFGSQIAMTLLRWTPVADGRRRSPHELGYEYRIADRDGWSAWLRRISRYAEPKLEVTKHRLRVADQGPPPVVPADHEAPPEPVAAG